MDWETELYESFERINIEAWPDVAAEDADRNGHVVWQIVDDLYTDYLDVRGFANVVISLDFRASTRETVQQLVQDGINAIWCNGLLITIDKCEWYYDFNFDLRGTVVTAVLRTEIELIEIGADQNASCIFYGDSRVWDTELVKSFNKAKVEAWPDVADQDANYEEGHVVWRQSDELVEDYLDTASTSQIEVELDFRAIERTQVQSIMRKAIDVLERTGQLIRAESAQWYFDNEQMIRGSVLTALLHPDPAIQPVGEFNSAFSSAFDVFEGESI